MYNFKVGEKVYRLVDNAPCKNNADEKAGKPWFTFESAVIVAVNPKTVKIRLREAILNSKHEWTRLVLSGKSCDGWLDDGFCVSKKEILDEELDARESDLEEAKEEVAYRQQFVSRLKRMIKNC